MATYEAIRTFVDLQDGRHKYVVGDVYPRCGYIPTKERIDELLSVNNKLGAAVIRAIVENPLPLTEEATEDNTPSSDEDAKPKAKRRAKKA